MEDRTPRSSGETEGKEIKKRGKEEGNKGGKGETDTDRESQN